MHCSLADFLLTFYAYLVMPFSESSQLSKRNLFLIVPHLFFYYHNQTTFNVNVIFITYPLQSDIEK